MRKLLSVLITSLLSSQLLAADPNPSQIWGTFQGNAAHTGYSNTFINPDAIKPLWSREFTTPEKTLTTLGQPIVVRDKLYFRIHHYKFGSSISYPDSLLALNAVNGDTMWEHDFDLAVGASSMSYDEGKLYFMLYKKSDLQRKQRQSNILIAAYDANTGTAVFSSPAQLSNGLDDWDNQAPVVDHHQLYLGTYSMQLSASADTGRVNWRSGDVAGEDNYAVVTDNYVIRIMNNAISLLSRKTGAFIKSIQGADTQYWTETMPLVLNKQQNVVYAVFNTSKSTKQLTALDLTTMRVKWKLDIPTYLTQPVYANGMIYVLQHSDASHDLNTVYAIDAKSGTIQWTLPINGDIRANPIVTNNALLIYAGENLMIVSLTSHQIIKTIATRGNGYMAVANNTLYFTEVNLDPYNPETLFVSAYALN